MRSCVSIHVCTIHHIRLEAVRVYIKDFRRADFREAFGDFENE